MRLPIWSTFILSALIASTTVWAAEPNHPAASAATPADRIQLLPGFKAELLYSVPRETQGSWVSITVDNKGRLITCDQYGRLYRVVPPSLDGQIEDVTIEPLAIQIGGAHGLLHAFDSLYVMVNERVKGHEHSSGLHRVRDTDGDDKFDEIELLLPIKGNGEHGPHAVILSPDNRSLYLCAGNHTDLIEVDRSTVPRNWSEDQLLGRMWDARGHAAGKLAPGGWVCRTDPDAKSVELVSIGYRNEFDIAFNADGELFTFDADMEWDIGAPWYRPTRINHVTSGSEFGWRSGTGKWPAYYPDNLPAVVDIGPGSPTGITFGTGARFPAKYQRALFACDWSYGILYAVHMEPDGASYRGTFEQFAAAAPLPLTDLLVHPDDGALYFMIGGRRVQSGLYRIVYQGDEPTEAVRVVASAGRRSREARSELERLHTPEAEHAVEKAWPFLSHDDRWMRYAARVALEHQPTATWKHRALGEMNSRALIHALLALVRNSSGSEQTAAQAAVIHALGRIEWRDLSESERLDLLRVYGLCFIRMGEPDDHIKHTIRDRLDSLYPSTSSNINRELCKVLVYLESPEVVATTLDLLHKAPTQDEQIDYAFSLRELRGEWSHDQYRSYFAWFHRAASHRGGMSFDGFIKNIRQAALDALDEETKASLDEVLSVEPQPADPSAELLSRPFVKKWTVDELLDKVDRGTEERDFSHGRQLFAAVSCYKCHRMRGNGGITGPDLTGAGRRFNSRDLLEAIIEPSKVVSDQYQTTMFETADGRRVVGRIVNLGGNGVSVITDLLDPSNITGLKREEIESIRPGGTSMMPDGLLDTLNADEILDLVGYLRSGGSVNPE